MLPKKPQNTTTTNRQRQPQPVERGKLYSYRASRATLETERNRLRPEASESTNRITTERREWLAIRRLPTLLAIVVIAGCLVYSSLLTTSPRVVVSGDAAEGLLLQDVDAYKKVIAAELASSPWYRTKITFDASKLHKVLVTEFPEIQNIRIALPLIGKKPIVYLDPAAPSVVLDTPKGSYVLDSDGKVIAKADSALPTDALRIRDESGLAINLGEQALPQSHIQFVGEMLRQLEAKDVTVSSVVLPANSQSVYFGLEGKPYQIRANFQGDVMQQAGAFLAVYDKLQQSGTNPTAYVDVRVGDRVYFR